MGEKVEGQGFDFRKKYTHVQYLHSSLNKLFLQTKIEILD